MFYIVDQVKSLDHGPSVFTDKNLPWLLDEQKSRIVDIKISNVILF